MEKFTLHHVGVAVRNLSAAITSYETLFDYALILGPFDDPIQNVSVCFLSRGEGDTVVELVAPLGPNSPIDLTLKKGGGPYHLCYQVPNMNSAIDHLTGQGSKLLSRPIPPITFPMREVAWLMTETGLLVELVQA
jgi:methylmalonyl-CoA/ethylmalonyl-CoA epimerase